MANSRITIARDCQIAHKSFCQFIFLLKLNESGCFLNRVSLNFKLHLLNSTRLLGSRSKAGASFLFSSPETHVHFLQVERPRGQSAPSSCLRMNADMAHRRGQVTMQPGPRQTPRVPFPTGAQELVSLEQTPYPLGIRFSHF